MGCWAVPSASTTYRSPGASSAVPSNTSRRPSGDHSGKRAAASPRLIWRTPEPSARIVKTWREPVRSLQKAILVPSGDQAGQASKAGVSVSCRQPIPFGLTVQSSKLPDRLLGTAIRPSRPGKAASLGAASAVRLKATAVSSGAIQDPR
jgi:hypothetical protein